MIAGFQELRPQARLYIALIVLAGAFVIVHSVHQLFVNPISNQWLILATLTLLSGSLNVKVSSINAYISVSEAFVFASILLFGTPAGTATVLIECMVILLWMKREGRLLHRVLFNMAAPSLAVWTAGTAFYLLSGIEPYSKTFTPLPQLFLPLLAFGALYFLLNSGLVAIAVGLENSRPPHQIWWQNFAWLSVNYLSGASLAALIVTYTKQLDLSTLAVIVPLLVVSYLTFRTAMGRAEDGYRHLSELNRLYLSTIETLAMAIDAKDQITHGHIRRVQTYAVGLAKKMGVSDEHLLKAIEAAALLHDMGKLAVPEHILNKPGKLTAAEFEKMKLHASFGADMLSAINFPYPVVPIVRHHHESWDGTGYPTGLKGTDIPIGARILSVVDCFDALTSDRPYRPRLSDDAALEILRQRRGTMYDPLVVDTFVRVHRDIAPPLSSPILPLHGSITLAPPSPPTEVLAQSKTSHTAAQRDVVVHHVMSRSESHSLAHNHHFSEALDTLLASNVPVSLAILYCYDLERDELVAEYIAGDVTCTIRDLRMSLGAQLSGWVAANRRTIVNSDPALDLGELASLITPRLRTSLCVPLTESDDLVGVLGLYSSADSFADEHRRIAENIAKVLARDTTPRLAPRSDTDPLTGLPMSSDIARVLASIDSTKRPLSLICVDVLGLADVNQRFGHDAGDRVLVYVAERIQSCLVVSDASFRCPGDEFAVLLGRSRTNELATMAKRIREAVRSSRLPIAPGESIQVSVSTNSLTLPYDSWSVNEVLAIAASSTVVETWRSHVH